MTLNSVLVVPARNNELMLLFSEGLLGEPLTHVLQSCRNSLRCCSITYIMFSHVRNTTESLWNCDNSPGILSYTTGDVHPVEFQQFCVSFITGVSWKNAILGHKGIFFTKILQVARVEAKLIRTLRELFSKPGSCLTHNAAEPLDDISGGTLSDEAQLPLEPQKDFCWWKLVDLPCNPSFLTFQLVLPFTL